MKIHAIIPARGGSKGIPHKNIIDFCGFPLLAWTINCAIRSELVEAVWVSTDDDEIAQVAREYGAAVIKRPEHLGSDIAASESALLHASEVIHLTYDNPPTHFLFLQATSPLRETNEIDDAIKKFSDDQLDSLFSAVPAEDFCLWNLHEESLKSLNFNYEKRGRRQDNSEDEIWIETGSFYISSISGLIKSKNRLHGKIGLFSVETWKVFEIDTYSSLDLCQCIFQAKLLSKIPSPNTI